MFSSLSQSGLPLVLSHTRMKCPDLGPNLQIVDQDLFLNVWILICFQMSRSVSVPKCLDPFPNVRICFQMSGYVLKCSDLFPYVRNCSQMSGLDPKCVDPSSNVRIRILMSDPFQYVRIHSNVSGSVPKYPDLFPYSGLWNFRRQFLSQIFLK
jgi:hypothetical protein